MCAAQDGDLRMYLYLQGSIVNPGSPFILISNYRFLARKKASGREFVGQGTIDFDSSTENYAVGLNTGPSGYLAFSHSSKYSKTTGRVNF